MSYSFRNKPRLSDRYRGKSGDEILNDLKKQIDEDRKMFFESSPGWNSVQSPFSRAGNPADDMMSRGRQDIRSHLDDLAQRHPEFADHLRCPPWGGEMGAHGSWGRKRRGSGSSGDDSESPSPGPSGQQASDEASPSRGRARQGNLPQHGLRNTVDIGQQQQNLQHEGDGDGEKRGQRSWSAPPPDNRTQNSSNQPRFVSRLDIPVNSSPSGVDQGKPPMAPKHNQQSSVPPQQQPQASSKPSQSGGNVRHIPIFVEGRDEPLLPKDVRSSEPERVFTERVPPQSSFNYGRPSHFTARSQPSPQPQVPPPTQSAPFTQSGATPKPRPFQQPPARSQSPQPQVPPQQVPPLMPKEPTPPPAPKPPVPNDPISQVQAVQKDVDELRLKVESFTGTSRSDKDYIYLDEMLTRNLLKLDNVETEGKENVRLARKEVIRNIQKCISMLESKVPIPEESGEVIEGDEVSGEMSGEGGGEEQGGESRDSEEQGRESRDCEQKMELDPPPQQQSETAGMEVEPAAKGVEKMEVVPPAAATADTNVETQAAQDPSTQDNELSTQEQSAASSEPAAVESNSEVESEVPAASDTADSNVELGQETMEVERSNSETLTVPCDAGDSGEKKDEKKGSETPKKSGKSPKSHRKGKKAT